MRAESSVWFEARVAAMLVTVLVAAGGPQRALAQGDPEQSRVLGTWRLVSEVVHQNGKTAEPLGHEPLGLMMLDRGGRFMLMIARRDLPRFAASKRNGGTAEENAAVLGGSLSFFGTYTVGGGVLTLKPEASTFPNWIGTDQKRYFTVDGDEMKWTNRAPAVSGETAELVWKRSG